MEAGRLINRILYCIVVAHTGVVMERTDPIWVIVCVFFKLFLEVAGIGLSDRVDIKCEGMEEIKDDLYNFYLIS